MNVPFISTADDAGTGAHGPGHARAPAPVQHPTIDTCLSAHAAGRCLRPLLDALGWRGEQRHLLEALPHFEQVEDIDALRAVLARLNYETHRRKVTLDALSDDALPCLFETADGRLSVIRSREPDGLAIFDGETGSERQVRSEDITGTVYLVREVDTDADQKEISRLGWIFGIVTRFKFLIWQLLGITFVTNVFALAIPPLHHERLRQGDRNQVAALPRLFPRRHTGGYPGGPGPALDPRARDRISRSAMRDHRGVRRLPAVAQHADLHDRARTDRQPDHAAQTVRGHP